MQCEVGEKKVTVIKGCFTPLCSCGREMFVHPKLGWICPVCGWGTMDRITREEDVGHRDL